MTQNNERYELHKAYRERAKDLYERVAVSHGETHGSNYIHEHVQITDTANVMIVEDGAYVEAIVWVAHDKLKRPKTHALTCPAYGNYQPPYENCTCGADE